MSRKLDRRTLVLLSALALILLVSVFSVTLWLAPHSPQPPVPDLTEVDPEVVEAITEAQGKVRQQPKRGDVWGRLGMVFLAHDFHEEAQFCFAQAERLSPSDGRWPY